MEEKNKKTQEMLDSTIGSTTSENIGRYGTAASEYIKGYRGELSVDGKILRKGLKQVAESKVNEKFEYQNLKQQAGFSAEIHYVDKENAETIIQGGDRRIYRSNDLGRGNDPVYDVLSVDEQGNPSWGAQMKFCGRFETSEEIQESAKQVVDKLAGPKWERYRGNKVLVPSEQYEEAKKYAEETAKKLREQAYKERLKGNYDKADMLDSKAKSFSQVATDLQDSGITSKEALFLREHPKLATMKYVSNTAHRAGLENAKSAAVISGAISVAQNVVSLVRDEKEFEEAVIDVGVTVAESSATAYLVGYGDAAIRGFMGASKNSVFVNLSKTNAPAMIATTVIQVGKSLIKYANGEINSLELVEELGEKGTGMMAASMGAAIGTAVFPGIGTVVGSMIGYMVSSTIYASCMQVLSEERISVEKRAKIHAIAETAIEAMHKQGQELLTVTEQFYNNRRRVFNTCINELHRSIADDNVELFTNALNNIAIEMGSTLKFKNFDEFDAFMSDSSTIFIF